MVSTEAIEGRHEGRNASWAKGLNGIWPCRPNFRSHRGLGVLEGLL